MSDTKKLIIKNILYITFSIVVAFGKMEHNKLIKSLCHTEVK